MKRHSRSVMGHHIPPPRPTVWSALLVATAGMLWFLTWSGRLTLIALFAAAAIVMAAFSELLGFAGTVLTVWCVYFFRNPDRVTPERDGLIISPADGIVQMIDQAAPPKELGMSEGLRSRVTVFMNVFDVHVNRVPLGGTITALHYRPGKFLNASLDKSSEFNERQSLRLTMADGRDMAFVQIAGLIARRILCDVTEGQTVKTGERFGVICFGRWSFAAHYRWRSTGMRSIR